MLPQHRQLVNLGGRSRAAMASFLRMSSYVLKEKSAKTEDGDVLKSDMPCQTTRQDRTWKSTQSIYFADAKVKAWSPSNGIRFSDGPSPPLPSRAEARKLSSSARTMAANEYSEDITDTTRQYEPSLGRDSTVVEVAGTEKTHSEERHRGNLDSRRAVTGSMQELGHKCAEQSLDVPLNAMVSSCASEIRAVTRSPEYPDAELPNPANLPHVPPDRLVKSPVRPNQTINFADKPNPSMVDQADLSQMSEVRTEMQKSAYNRVHHIKRGNGASLAISAFITHNMRHRFNEAMRIQEHQRNLLNVILEIDRLLRESIALPDLTLKLRDLQNHIRLYCEQVHKELYRYQILLAMVDNSRKLVKRSNQRTHHTNVIMLKRSSMGDTRNLWESLFLAPYIWMSQSPKSLWRAIRSLLTFRYMAGQTRIPKRERRIRQVLGRFRDLMRAFTDDRFFCPASLDAQKGFSRQYPNTDARASALLFQTILSELNSKCYMLTNFWLRHGLVSIAGSSRSRTDKWRRIMLHMKKFFEDHSTELHQLMRTFESDLLEDPQASTVTQSTSFKKQESTDIASTFRRRLTLTVSELCQELRRGRRFAQHFEDVVAQRPRIDIRKDMLRMLEEPYLAEPEPAAAIAGTDSGQCVMPPWEDQNNETCCRSKSGLLSSGSLGFQCSAPLTCSDLSTSKYLTQSEPFYPVIDGLQFASRPADYGTNENGGSPMEDSTESSTPSENLPFSTPLGYHIPKAKLQRAINAAPSSTAAYWQYTLYQGPDGEKDKVKVHYCKSKDSTERISQLFLHKDVIGFDIEWKMNATATDGVKKNVALIQIASEERIALFHIARYPNATDVDDFVAPTFKRIMESSNITKVGVSVKGDCTRLRKFMNIEARGIFELSHLHKLVKFSCGDVKKINKVMVSLAQQVEEHLRLPLWKGEVRSSDWSQDLNYQQIQYAASDSYAGFQLFHILEAKRQALNPTPPRPAHAELNLPIRLANGRTVATYNDEVPESVEDSSLDTGPDTPISIEELARDFLNLEIEEPYLKELPGDPPVQKAAKGTTKATSSSKSSSPAPSPTPPPLHPSVILANTWLIHYTTTLSPSRPVVARPADLRAYHLWYHQELDIQEIASRLRDPPLAISTVAGYVLRAIQMEKLPFHRKKIWGLVSEVHESFRGGYKGMIIQRVKEEGGG